MKLIKCTSIYYIAQKHKLSLYLNVHHTEKCFILKVYTVWIYGKSLYEVRIIMIKNDTQQFQCKAQYYTLSKSTE